MKNLKKTLALVLVVILALSIGVAGTLAYLTDTTDAVTNTFTVGNVSIKLYETKDNKEVSGLTDLKMIPGSTIDKDPTIEVNSGSENCYVFVKVEGNDTYAKYLSHEMAQGWTEVETGVYVYAKDGSNSIPAGEKIQVLKDDQVTVLTDVTQEMMDAITDKTAAAPTLTFTAYAVQFENVASVAAAWTAISGS